MKNLILIILLFVSIGSFAQAKKPAPPAEKPKYERVVVLNERDAQTCIEALQNWQRLTIYDPILTSDQKVNQTIAIQNFMKNIKIRIDSIRTDTVRVVPPKKK